MYKGFREVKLNITDFTRLHIEIKEESGERRENSQV